MAAKELMDELGVVRKDYARATLQVAQQETFINHLKEVEIKKDAKIAQLEEDLTSAQKLSQQELGIAQEEAKTSLLDSEHRIRYLELEVGRLKEENGIYLRFEGENREVRQTLIQQQEQIERLQKINDELRSSTRDDLTEYRAQMEEEFRQRLAESEQKFESAAYSSLSEQAKVALQGNEHLNTVLQKQNDSIEGVLARCKQLEASHTKMKIEQELALQNNQLQQQEVHHLRRQLTDSRTRCKQLEDSLKQRRVERASLELLYMEYESTRTELTKVKEECKKAKKQAERWKQRVMNLQADADGTVATTANPPGSRGGSRGGIGLSRSFGTGQAWKDMGPSFPGSPGQSAVGGAPKDQSSEQSDPPAKLRIDPMEIISMWNVNFEGWKPEDGKEISGLPGSENLPTSTERHATDLQREHQEATQAAMAAPPTPTPADVTLPGAPAGSADGGAPAPRAIGSHTAKRSTEWDRVEKDREMSVLSRRKFKAVPPGARSTGAKAAASSGRFPTQYGTVPFSSKDPLGGQRFLAP